MASIAFLSALALVKQPISLVEPFS